MSFRSRRIAALSAVALAVVATPAGADTFCVGAARGCVDTVQQALDAAAVHDGHDTVKLGPGRFEGPVHYGALSATSGAVHVRGAGRGRTKIIGPADSDTPVLTLAEPGSKASGLRIHAKGALAGVWLESATLDDARITGTYKVAVPATGDSEVRRTDVDVHGGWAFELFGDGDCIIEDSSIRAVDGVIANKSSGRVVVRRTRSAIGKHGVLVQGGTVRIEDSQLTVHSGAYGLMAVGQSDEHPAIEARHVTLVHTHPANNSGSRGVLVRSSSGGSAFVKLRDSVLHGFYIELQRDGYDGSTGSSADVAWTRIDPERVVEHGPGTLTIANTTSAAPAFVDPAAGDYALRPTSPLVDAGDPAGPGPGDPLADLAGHPRYRPHVLGGAPRSDLGAVETSPVPPRALRVSAFRLRR